MLALLALIVVAGCGQAGLETTPVHGTVTCGGEPAQSGYVRFVPLEGTPGPASMGLIVDGRYRIDGRGGVPVGRHRVEIQVQKKTGRQVAGHTGTETAVVEEMIVASPAQYAGSGSPLVVEVGHGPDGRHDFDLPPPASPH